MTVRVLVILLLFVPGVAASRDELTLDDVLRRAREASPASTTLAAVDNAETAAVEAALPNYAPVVEFNALATEGFPAGVAQLGGLPGAAFRSGPAMGLVVRQPLWDFGRGDAEADVRRTEMLKARARERGNIEDDASQTLGTFLECAYMRENVFQWRAMLTDFETIRAQIESFVRSGQRSKVEEALADAQVEEARTQLLYYEGRARFLSRQLAKRLGADEAEVACPLLGDKTRAALPREDATPPTSSPLLQAFEAESRYWEARGRRASKEFSPQLQAIASYGVMVNRAADPDNYALGVGLRVPLFDGGREAKETAVATNNRSLAEARRNAMKERLSLRLRELRAQVVIQESKRDRLRAEVAALDEAFRHARKRYFLLQGQLVDLRETVRNLARRRSALAEARYEAHLARARYRLLTSS